MSSFFSRAFKEASETCPTETWSEHEDVEESSIFGKVKFAESQLIPDGEIGFQRNTDEKRLLTACFLMLSWMMELVFLENPKFSEKLKLPILRLR